MLNPVQRERTTSGHMHGLAACAWLVLSGAAALAADPPDRAALDERFRTELETLATRCDELGLPAEAATTRAWFVQRDPRRHYLFIPPTQDPARPAADAAVRVNQWYARFCAVRRDHAGRLYELAGQQAAAGDEGRAFRLLHEVLHEDPDHAESRRVLGYVQGPRGWRHPARRPKVQRNRSAQRVLGGRSELIDSEHFQVATNHHARAALDVAEYLERVLAAWQQLYYEYWTVAGRLTARLGGSDAALGPEHTYDVVLFKSRDDYVNQLSSAEPQIELSVGYYAQGRKTAFFYAGDDAARTTWVHEATHQFFQESGEVAPMVGEQSNFWIVEGVAQYMESLKDHGAYWTAGGIDADRLQYARYRVRNENYYLPLETLVTYGRLQLQKDPELSRLYSQCAGLVHCFMDSDQGRHAAPLISYLRTVYRGTGEPQTLSTVMGQRYPDLDELYRNSLDVTDEDLVHVDRRIESLCLAHTRVTDAGLVRLPALNQLRWLDLSFTSAGDAGLASFAQSQQLRQLSLEKTRITAASIDFIARLRQLEELDLSQTAIGDDDLPQLARLTRLKTLWLTGTHITDEGLPALAPLRSLEQLEVGDTAVTSDALENLRKRLPRLK